MIAVGKAKRRNQVMAEINITPFTDVVLVSPLPSPVIVVSAGGTGIPDSGSAAVQWTVTSPAYQPSRFGDVVGAPERVGAVVSPAGAVDLAVAMLPALSVAKYETTWVPSPVTVTVALTAWTVLCCPSSNQELMDSTPLLATRRRSALRATPPTKAFRSPK